MNIANIKASRWMAVLALAATASFASIQAAHASSFDFYGHGVREHRGSSHGGCGGGDDGGGDSDCVTTNYSSSFYAYETDASTLMDGDISDLKTLSVNIAYSPANLSSILLDSAYLYIKAGDDATGGQSVDGFEYLDILKVEGQSVNVNKVEVDSSGWYFKFNVKEFVTGNHTSPLDILLAVVNFGGCAISGQDDLFFQNARLDLNYHEVDCTPPNPVPLPAAGWMFLSALIGFVSMSNRRKV